VKWRRRRKMEYKKARKLVEGKLKKVLSFIPPCEHPKSNDWRIKDLQKSNQIEL